jgi:hypothetical protein
MTFRSPRALQLGRRSIGRSAPVAPLVLVAVLAPCGLVGCGANAWEPASPRGETYEYDYQGFRSSGTTVVAGSGPAGGYGAAFSFRDAREVHPEAGGKDPFAQSEPIDGLRFNAHLERQGARLTPSSGSGKSRVEDGASREGERR